MSRAAKAKKKGVCRVRGAVWMEVWLKGVCVATDSSLHTVGAQPGMWGAGRCLPQSPIGTGEAQRLIFKTLTRR